MHIVRLIVLAAGTFVCIPATAKGQTWENGVVAADHEQASHAGVEILKRGGNAVDAAVATSFALAVVRPSSCGLGGGGFMMIYLAETQKVVGLDYRETAPKHATPSMFKGHPGVASRQGGLSIGVPGTVAGLFAAHQQYGDIEWKTVLQPAIDLARGGYVADKHTVRSQSAMIRFLLKSGLTERYAPLWRFHLNNGSPLQSGQLVYSPLLRVLEHIQARGRDGFYDGEIARSLLQAVTSNGGIWRSEDLSRSRKVVTRTPVNTNFEGLTLYSMPPPSSGGVAIVEALNIIKELKSTHRIPSMTAGSSGSVAETHFLAETLKHVFADRASYLGDPDYEAIQFPKLISEQHARILAGKIEHNRTLDTQAYGTRFVNDDNGTSHFSIIDRFGNAVACTETINGPFGSLVADERYGIVLNNEMDDFSTQPGKPNMFGLVQSEVNCVKAGKRPLSSMMPTIVIKDGAVVSAFGASGGPRIISTCLQVFLNVHRRGMPPLAALSRSRIHHQWMPNKLVLPRETKRQIVSALQSFGHKTELRDDYSAAQLVFRASDGQLTGASDPRKGGVAHGY